MLSSVIHSTKEDENKHACAKMPPSLSALSACQQNGNTSAYKKEHRKATVIAS